MSTSVENIVYAYTGNGSTTVFTFPAKFLDNSHIDVYVDGVKQSSGYTVSGAGNQSGGSVTFTTAPASAAEVVLVNNPPLTQALDLTFNGKMPSTSIENSFDKVTMLTRLLDKRVDKALKFPVYDTGSEPADITEAARKNKLLGFDSTGRVELTSRAQATYQSGNRMVFASVSALTTEASITSVSSGDVVLLTGYYAAGDFGAPIELVVEASTGGVKSHTLSDGRYANLYADNELNVKWFGAKGDDTTDDTAAIQSAVDAAGVFAITLSPQTWRDVTAEGITVFFPKGKYLVKDSITYGPNIRFKGLGWASQIVTTLNVGSSAWLTSTAYNVGDLITVTRTFTLTDGSESGTVKSFPELFICTEAHTSGTFQTDFDAGKWNWHSAFKADKTLLTGGSGTTGYLQGNVFEDLLFYTNDGYGCGINLEDVDKWRVSNILFEHFNAAVIAGRAAGNSTAVYHNRMDNCKFWNNRLDLQLGTTSNATTVIGCVFNSNLYSSGYQFGEYAIINKGNGNSFIGCSIENMCNIAKIFNSGAGVSILGGYHETKSASSIGHKPLIDTDMSTLETRYGSITVSGLLEFGVKLTSWDLSSADDVSTATERRYLPGLVSGTPYRLRGFDNGSLEYGMHNIVQNATYNGGTVAWDTTEKFWQYGSVKLTKDATGTENSAQVSTVIPGRTLKPYIGQRIFACMLIKEDSGNSANHSFTNYLTGAGSATVKYNGRPVTDFGNGWKLYVVERPILDTVDLIYRIQQSGDNGDAMYIGGWAFYVGGFEYIPAALEEDFTAEVFPVDYETLQSSTSGSATVGKSGLYYDISTGATGASTGYLRLAGAYSSPHIAADARVINWSKLTMLEFDFVSVAGGATYDSGNGHVRRVVLGKDNAAGVGDLAQKGIGFEWQGQDLFGVCYDGSTLTKVDLGIAYTNDSKIHRMRATCAGGVVNWWVDDALVGSSILGPSGSGGSTDVTPMAEAVNGTQASDNQLWLGNLRITGGR